MPKTEKLIEIYTDGACSGNPGPGGWGAILIYGPNRKEISGGAHDTTNNRMELTAAIKALETLQRPVKGVVHTDSVYLKEGITTWLRQWKARGWRTAAKKPVKNEDLWRQLDDVLGPHDITWIWVKGHDGHDENERADELAREGMAPYRD